jgi:hypothetical protein
MGEARRRAVQGLPPRQPKKKLENRGYLSKGGALVATHEKSDSTIRGRYHPGSMVWHRCHGAALDHGALYWASGRLVDVVRHALTTCCTGAAAAPSTTNQKKTFRVSPLKTRPCFLGLRSTTSPLCRI